MRVETLGDGEPEVAIVGGIHGDEPCGPRAIEAILDAELEFERPVKLIVANEEALDAGVRYLETDLNRAFPGSPDADTHEERLAHALLNEIRGCQVLSLHSTQSYAAPFALVDTLNGFARSICPYLSIESIVETAGFSDGRLISYPETIEMECGLQRSAGATENAIVLSREFLVATGAVAGGETPRRHLEVPVFRLVRQVRKSTGDDYEVFVDNFERVAAGSKYAGIDGEPLVAEEPFYPILLSAHGYEDVFGYAAEFVGRLDSDRTEAAGRTE
ncbi:MAG: succinylglutamate desuccinylase/aspartoacylase family protein [Natronomonas sp.]